MGCYLCITFCVGLSCMLITKTNGACTFPSYMTGTWYDNLYVDVEFLGNTGMYLSSYSIERSLTSETTNLTCHLSSGNTYILRTTSTVNTTISGNTDNYYHYICMDITKITDYSFYYYTQSNAYPNGERTVAKISTVTVSSTSDICVTPSIATELFHVMVRKDYASSAVQQFPDLFLGNFSFSLSSSINAEGTGNLTACATLNTANVIYETAGSPNALIGFAANKYIGCLVNIQSDTTYYMAWYNFDSTTDLQLHSRFACVVATLKDSTVYATQRSRICSAGQTSTSMPSTDAIHPVTGNSASGKITLEPYVTCVPAVTTEAATSTETETETATATAATATATAATATATSSSSSSTVIAIVVVLLLLLIACIIGGILCYKFKYIPGKERKAKLLEEQKAPRSHIGMTRTAVLSGNGDQFHKEQNGFGDMVDVEDEGVEGTITGVNPNTFKEHNNNMKLNAKCIGTTAPLTPSSVETEFTDPNAVNLSNEKRTVTSGFSANMQGTTVNDTPTTNAELNGRVPNGNLQTDMKGRPVVTVHPTTTTPAVIPNTPNRVQREKSINTKQNQVEPTNTSSEGPATDKKTAIATVNPYTDENPKIIQENTRVSDDKRDDKMRKSVSFATDNPLINANASPGTNNALPNTNTPHNTSLPGTVPGGPGPIITLAREPSNLMPPRDTTLPEIDL